MLGIHPGPGLKTRRDLARLSSLCLAPSASGQVLLCQARCLFSLTSAPRLTLCFSVPSVYGTELAAACQSVCLCVHRGEIKEY